MIDFTQAYQESDFLDFMQSFLPDFSSDKQVVLEKIEHFQEIYSLGNSANLDNLKIFAIKVPGSLNRRIAITNSAFKLMKITNTYRSLIAFYADDTPKWRLSFLTAEPVIENGKIVTSFSNPKRYSYVLGPRNKLGTPIKQLLQKGRVENFEELQNRFALEVVNNAFYKEIAGLYDRLVGNNGLTPLLKHPEDGEPVHHFAVRLIGRIIFCWFLREKRSSNNEPLLPMEVLSRQAAAEDDYYNKVLAPLFFDILNKQPQYRDDKHLKPPYDIIPYLNGGLFAPKDDYYKYGTDLNKYVPNAIEVPDVWLRELFDLLETYNFTIDENTSYDIELSIDPEMLGRIFENLLATINPETKTAACKETGSFYTPREIVDYMVDESLYHHLHNTTKIKEAKLKALISYNLLDDKDHPLKNNEKMKIVDSLSNVHILDPACGSGAFPIGILQKIVFILQQVDPEAEQWLEKQTAGGSPEFKRHLRRESEKKNFDYLRKLGIVRECIYGVDIQPIATEISRLRCFLTLIVDQSIEDDEPNRGIKTLPNLDFKFITADTLMPLVEENNNGQSMFERNDALEEWKNLRDYYFSSYNPERENLQYEFTKTQNDVLRYILGGGYKDMSERTSKIAAWQPFEYVGSKWFDAKVMLGVENGFDIIIGNPPYVQIKKGIYPEETFTHAEGKDKGKQNLYKLFIEHAYNSLSNQGVVCLIVQSTILCDLSNSGTRYLLLEKANIHKAIEFPKNSKDKVFKNVMQGTAIVVCGKMCFESPETLLLSYNNSLRDVNHLQFNQINKNSLRQLFPINLYFPLLSKQELELMHHISERSVKLSALRVQYKKGDISLDTERNIFGSQFKGVPLLRGKHISLYALNTNSGEFIDLKYKKEVSDRNKANQILVGQNVTGTTDKKRIIFALADGVECLYGDSVNKLDPGDQIKPKVLLAILNSKLIDWYFRKTSTNNHVNSYELNALPIAKNHKEYVDKLLPLIDQMLKRRSNELINKIDALIYEMYDLTNKEVEIIERKLQAYS